jgi:hypothetical protein
MIMTTRDKINVCSSRGKYVSLPITKTQDWSFPDIVDMPKSLTDQPPLAIEAFSVRLGDFLTYFLGGDIHCD